MHVRRSDFETWCRPGIPKEECLPQLSAFALRIREIRDELRAQWAQRLGLDTTTSDPDPDINGGGDWEWDIKHVVVTSDEPLVEESPFWEEVFGYGWVMIDHVKERTVEKYGGYVCFLCISERSLPVSFEAMTRNVSYYGGMSLHVALHVIMCEVASH